MVILADKTQSKEAQTTSSPREAGTQYQNDTVEMALGDNIELIRHRADNSVHAVIADPPYRIDFMGKKWDAKQSDFRPIWAECLRVLMPGGFSFLMSDARQDVSSLLICELRDVGFEIDFDPIEWVYLTGYPKAQNFYKALDKQAFSAWLKIRHPWWHAALKFGSELLNNRDSPLPKEEKLEIQGDYLRLYHEWKVEWAQQEYGVSLNSKKYEHWGRQNRQYATEVNIFSQDRKGDILAYNMPDGDDETDLIDCLTQDDPVTPEAIRVAGMYAAEFKPARELIIIARKPLVAPTNLEHCKVYQNGGLYMDRGRIPSDLEDLVKNAAKGYCGSGGSGTYGWNSAEQQSCKESAKPPLNRDAQKKILRQLKTMVGGRLQNPKTFGQTEQTGYKIQIPKKRGSLMKGSGDHGYTKEEYPGLMDLDLRGRFPATLLISDDAMDPAINEKFSLDRWWWAQIKQLPSKIRRNFPFLAVPKPTKKEKNLGLEAWASKKVNDGRKAAIDNPFQRGESLRKNTHISVKPIQLMSYLIAISPTKTGDVILDPFMGSGTTGIACAITGRRFVGYENDLESFAIAVARVKRAQKQRRLLVFAEIEQI
jgi:DNA modification methylase